MARLPRPTDAELAILRVIWTEGPSTVRQIRDVLNRRRPTLYTTVLKLLQIMTAKGLVGREEHRRGHVYAAAVSEASTQRQLVRDLLVRAFGGSASALVMQALATTRVSAAELKQIERLLARREKGPPRDE
ncbi:MAG TPA: BlaI/MecI/CopY family transcriptional regulator [Vicinamibacterales bacterium]|nr:BlaI/MecI/CopY family transcriptional regulator [Vicinamibacterales bacterium]